MPQNKTPSTSVAVVITNYNKGDLLLRAIQSIAQQTQLPDEFILVDDCSDDKQTLTALASLPALDVKTTLIRNPQRLGASGAMNAGIVATTSESFMLLDADDELPPEAVAHTKKAFTESPDADFIYGDVLRISRKGSTRVLMSGSAYTARNGTVDLRLLAKAWELHGTSPMRKKLFDAMGGLDLLHPRTNDSDFFRRALAAGRIGKYVPETIYITYLDESQNSQGIDPLVLSSSWFRGIEFYLKALAPTEFVAMFLKKSVLLFLRIFRQKVLDSKK